jgi:hypothetical protein
MTTFRPWCLLVSCLVLSCASNQKIYGGTELEGGDENRSGDLNMTGVAGGTNSTVATKDQGDLSASFEPEPSHDDSDSDPEGDDAPPPPSRTPTARDQKEEAFEAKRQKGLRLANAGKGAEALQIGQELENEAATLPPWRLSHALEVQSRAYLATRDIEAARKTAESWLLSCGPDKPDSCRARALWVLGRAAQIGKMPNLKTRVEKLGEHDKCVRKVEGGMGRAEGQAPECLNEALAAYRAGRDHLMEQRVQYARGVAISGKESQRQAAIFAFARAESMCKEARCVGWRRKALKRLSNLYAADGDTQKSAEMALAEAHLYADTLPEEVKKYAMTTEALAACERLDTKSGPGTCRKWEKQKFGDHLFLDFSQQKARSGLSPDLVKKVNAHFGILVEPCLDAEKTRIPPLSQYTYKLKWVVQNDGSVAKVEVGGDGRQDSDLGRCIVDQFSNWRYPRYSGEFQHVEQNFTIANRTRPNDLRR